MKMKMKMTTQTTTQTITHLPATDCPLASSNSLTDNSNSSTSKIPTPDQLIKWADKVNGVDQPHKERTFDDVKHDITGYEQSLITRYVPTSRVNVGALQRRCQQSIDDLIGHDREFLYIDNGAKVLAVAHVDTVFSPKEPTFSRKSDYVISGSLDDRLGVYILLDYLPQLGLGQQYDILLTTDEEMCQSTAHLFRTPEGKSYNWIFEFDRSGSDPVMYQYHNQASEELLLKHDILLDHGSYSDIADLESLGVKAFNFGVGYYNAHTTLCHTHLPLVGALVERFRQFFLAEQGTYLPHTITERHKKDRYQSDKHNWYADYVLGQKDYDRSYIDDTFSVGADVYYQVIDSLQDSDIAECAVRDSATAEAVLEHIALEYGVDFVLSVLGITPSIDN